MPDLTSDIATQALEPSSVSADGQSASARPVADLVTAQQFLDARSAMRKRRRGVTFTKLVPPGAACDEGRTGVGAFNTPGGY